MKTIFISSLVLFSALFAINLDAGQKRGCRQCHQHANKSRVSFNVGTVGTVQRVATVAAYVPVQQAPVVVQQPVYYAPGYYPASYVEYQQPVVQQVIVQPRPSPWSFFNFGFSFGN